MLDLLDSVLVTCLKLISNVLSVYQRTRRIFHTSAYVGAVRSSVTGPLVLIQPRKTSPC